MPRSARPPSEPTDDWQQLQLRLKWPEQVAYEIIRPVVLFARTARQRAEETGTARRTIARKAARFDAQGMRSLFPPDPAPAAWRELPRPMQQALVDLRVQYPAFRPHELAAICYVQFGRRPSPHTVQRILAEGPPPSRTTRRVPRYHDINDPAGRRFALLRLHSEGWNIKSIAGYMEISRTTVYETLRRWVEEKVLTDKSRAPRTRVRKVDLQTMDAVRRLQENPELGEWRIHAALKQMGIHLSPRTCRRILARNRALYGSSPTEPPPREPKPHPFKAQRRHQYWTVDIRYIDAPSVSTKPLYVISILENFSRAMLASAVSRTQDLQAYLRVLHAAIREHGVPETLVSDSGRVFRAKHAAAVYAALGIEKVEIAKRQAWQSLIETQFNVQRRMADYHFGTASSWEELQAIHAQWVSDFNTQVHWAHRHRQDNRHSPAEVLGWVQGKVRPLEELDRVFYAWRFARQVNGRGYVRFRQWLVYGERGLDHQQVAVWLYNESLTLEFGEEPLAQYEVAYQADGKHLREVKELRLFATRYRSPQLELWTWEEVEWRTVQRLTVYPQRTRPAAAASQLPLFTSEAVGS